MFQRNWNLAKQICIDEESSLLTLDTDEKANSLYNHFKSK
jgi:hypothetical protein